jgi:1-acyl-sn-glycerol-3-phosphate acyltransferase
MIVLTYIKIFLIAIYCLIIAILTIICSPFDPKGKIVHKLSKIFSRVILIIAGVKIDVSGIEKLNPSEQYIIVSNHLSLFDIPILMQCIPNNLRFIYKKSLTNIPIFGWAMYLGKYIPIDRKDGRSALKSLRKAVSYINKGISVSIFPEGTRSKDGSLGKFKKGIFVIADEAMVKIVPVTIIGTNRLMSKNKLEINPGTAKVIIHNPIEFQKDKNFLNEIRGKIASVI